MALSNIKKKAAEAAAAAATATELATPAKSPDFIPDFYRVRQDAEGNFKGVEILQTGFLALLRRLGFRRYDVADKFIIVKINDRVIEQIPLHRLRELVVRYFNGIPEETLLEMEDTRKRVAKADLIEKLHRSLSSLTTDDKLALLVDLDDEEIGFNLLEDTRDEAYFFFANGFVTVSKSNGITIRPYSEMQGFIWRDQILPRNFEKLPPKEVEKGYYWQFANNVSGNFPDEKGNRQDPERFAAFLTITGYNLHRYFNQKLKATIFLDARVSDEPDGRSGKSLHTKAIQMVLNKNPYRNEGKQAVVIDGKNFDPENRFALDDLDISTKLVIFDDTKKSLRPESFFNWIVDGLTSEKKNGGKVRIPAKIILTLNYTLSLHGGSAKDRFIEFEFADYYSSDRSPEQEFGHWFFRDWDEKEWARFDNFMMICVLDYLTHGLIMPSSINLEKRKLIDDTNQEFVNFMDELGIEHQHSYDKKELFNKFVDMDENGKARNLPYNQFKINTFSKWLSYFAEFRPEFAGYRDFRSNGKSYFQYFYNQPITVDLGSLGTNNKYKIFDGPRASNVKLGKSRVEDNDLPF